ncbi:YbhB/YbcL family Raf kinase inhibitor-like protein [Propylenella binzhouense]|uniref:YbhB/YbcL family Raf kinase inhibitor-like protein n=1 Tax=Propylenella binzhouense TaxID=2555902 RepID=A0A964T5X3_9HYPH|nr:YbhB/YbcL family Raf kinase inhibitor-like protein [Propylenella binzhouense]MYZ48404.1 YbhB/YbcL family Raf kinase inhibitor-like protein [Propylenella binzhouense]
MAFMLESPAFRNGEPIPERYARDGENVSPALAWHGAPAETKSFVVIVEDPDAPTGTFRHWAVYDIDGGRTRLPEGAPAGARAEQFPHGVNDFGNPHYDGPQPPRGHGVHRYRFRLAALDVESLGVPPRAKVEEVWREAGPHILAEADLVGTFERR